MLQSIRDNPQDWITKTIIDVIIILLSLTGFDAVIRATDHSNVAVKVNGDDIGLNEVRQVVDMQRRQLLQRLGKDFSPSVLDDRLLKETTLKGLIERILLLQAAKDDEFASSNQTLDQLILQAPEFQVDGKFNANRFDQVIRQMNRNRIQFHQMLDQEMFIGQLRAGLTGTSFVTGNKLQSFARLEKQTRNFTTLAIKADASKSSVSEDEVKAFYEGHKNELMAPEQVVTEYVELKGFSFFDQVKVKQEDLGALYQKEIANLPEQRDAAHILVEVNDKVGDKQARAKIDEIKARLAKGEDFTTLVKGFPQDIGLATTDGGLGYVDRGVYDPAFEEALYMLKQGEVSVLVRTPYGCRLIKLLGVQAPGVPDLESLKPKLESELKKQIVEQHFIEATRNLESSACEAADLSQPAQEMGLKVQTSQPFGHSRDDDIAASRQIVQTAFSPGVLEEAANSGAVELDPDTVVVLRVREHNKPREQPLEQVTVDIRECLAAEEAVEETQKRDEALIAELRKGRTSPAAGEPWKVVEAASRSQEGIGPKLLQAVFRMQRPEAKDKSSLSGVTLANGDCAMIRLNDISKPEEAISDDEKVMCRRFLASHSGQADFAAFRRQLQDKVEVEKY